MTRLPLFLLAAALLAGCGAPALADTRPTLTPLPPMPTALGQSHGIGIAYPTAAPYPAPDAPGVAGQIGAPAPSLAVAWEHGRVRVTWQAAAPVCPWLIDGRAYYAGGDQPCRSSGSALLAWVPGPGAAVELRDPGGAVLARVAVPPRYVRALPLVAK